MPRYLCLAVNDHGNLAAAIVNDSEGLNLPFGTHAPVIDRMADVSELTAIVQLPEGDDFRPDVIDPTADAEIGVTFIDL